MSFETDNNLQSQVVRAGYPTPLPDPISKPAIEVADAFNELWINEDEAKTDTGLGSASSSATPGLCLATLTIFALIPMLGGRNPITMLALLNLPTKWKRGF